MSSSVNDNNIGNNFGRKCIVCYSTQRIQKDHEIICKNCGVVCDTVSYEQTDAVQSGAMSQNTLGSKNPIDPKLNLEHINKKRTAMIMEKNDKNHSEFLRCCSLLKMPKHASDTAFEMFKKLMTAKLGKGKTAVFCIYQSCVICEILADSKNIISTVRSQFRLKRLITLSDAMYSIKPTALEMRLILSDESVSDSYAIKRHIAPVNHVKATKLLNKVPSERVKGRTKLTQRYLRSYEWT